MCSLLMSTMAVHCGYVTNFDRVWTSATYDSRVIYSACTCGSRHPNDASSTTSFTASKANLRNELSSSITSTLPDLVSSHVWQPAAVALSTDDQITSQSSSKSTRRRHHIKKRSSKKRNSRIDIHDPDQRLQNFRTNEDYANIDDRHEALGTQLLNYSIDCVDQKTCVDVGKKIRKIADEFAMSNNRQNSSNLVNQLEPFQKFATTFMVISFLGILSLKMYHKT